MKPNNFGDQFIIENTENIQGLTGSTTPETLQLILADNNIDKSIMFDLSKIIHENPNLGMVQPRVIVSSPSQYSTVPVSVPVSTVPIPDLGLNLNHQHGQQSLQGQHQQQHHQGPPQGIAIPKRPAVYTNVGDDILSGHTTTSSSTSTAAYATGSSYEVSPRPALSPVLWDPGHVQIKEEESGPGLHLSGGHSEQIRVNTGDVFYSNTPDPTLAQLNSPPTEDLALTTLKNLEDIDSIDLDISDILLNYSNQFSDIKVEPGSVGVFQWGKESSLSSSVPVSVISNAAEYQELSNGGPAISPSRLTLSPSRLSTIPSRSTLSPPTRTNLSPISQPLSPPMQAASMSLAPRSPHNSTLHELLMRQDPLVPDPIRPRSSSNQYKSAKRPIAARQRNSLSISSPLLASQLSKSAPVKTLPIEQMIWSRREARPHMNSVCSNAGDSSIADEVSEIMNSLSPSELNEIDSEDEALTNTELETDEDLRIDEDEEYGEGSSSGGSKKERHFWQYNVQAKGPKGQKLALDTKIYDPHCLNEIIDPVFDDSVQVHGIKHSGKARRGDGNDLTANPKKLAMIGKELEKINKEINHMTPVSEVPFSTRSKSRKEKNKLASRACRLKKKAQHEANKLKLHGLDEEHLELMRSIAQVKEILQAKWAGGGVPPGAPPGTQPRSHEDLSQEAEKIQKRAGRIRVAGQTTDYVNRMIAKYS